MYDDCYRVLNPGLLCVGQRREGHVNLSQVTLGGSKDRYTSTGRLSQGFSPSLYIPPLGRSA
jgi:hypothetical protein